ncbi:MAG: ATP cone domain-containing protein, partial [Patescibacteria group bacterium]
MKKNIMLQTNPRRYRKATKGKIRNGEKTNGNGHSELQIFSIPKTIIKRDGRIVPFEISKIENAIAKCFKNLKTEPNTPIPEL